MLDMKLIRTETDRVKKAMANRGRTDLFDVIDEILVIDEKRREVNAKNDTLKAEQNKASKEIPAMMKDGKDTTELKARMKDLADAIKLDDTEISAMDAKIQALMYELPNIPDETVPVGKDDTENVEVRRIGTPKQFAYEPKPHWELGASLGILDPESAGKVTGSRFHFYVGMGARLERAIINFFMDTHAQNGFTEVLPPYLVNEASMIGTTQLPKFAEDMYKVEGENYYLIPTAEVPVTNMHREEILDGNTLPLRYCGYSACFRGEAGAASRDTRGLIRQHQFNKVEMVKFARPDQSWEELESMTAEGERVLKLLGLPFRTIALCTGDMGFASAKTYDIEVWMPSYGRYVEISSCSNCTDFQARRASIRFKKDTKSKAELAHTLNGSGVAVGRTTAAILENYQNDDGTVTIPDVLVPYMLGVTKIEKK